MHWKLNIDLIIIGAIVFDHSLFHLYIAEKWTWEWLENQKASPGAQIIAVVQRMEISCFGKGCQKKKISI